jgi:hypothetical protein
VHSADYDRARDARVTSGGRAKICGHPRADKPRSRTGHARVAKQQELITPNAGAIRPIPNEQNGAEKAVGAMLNEWRPLTSSVSKTRRSAVGKIAGWMSMSPVHVRRAKHAVRSPPVTFAQVETQGLSIFVVQAATSGRDGSLIDLARSNLSR